MTIDMNIY